ncbi:hypothetical protein IGB42_04077 [Andreprevotia sp. IGB-42]|uniref:dihydrofolate reductase family protein n=1 Tax=Andreprevotia sp. IGB-42 TaxID=2497473 RepID=UPI001356D2C4|nr:dihydrofolate reductase family protein [Andreprevotia sp. IGB-42]KAF0811459.1 hypothetical protein IGB42_04077 [Andreprevotia sp. IGB-42]
MRKLILQMQMSVDGFMAARNGMDWQLWGWGDNWRWDDVLKRDFNAVFDDIDCILLSRKMAEEGYLDHWGRAATAFAADPHYAFARRIVAVQKVVTSSQLTTSRWPRTTVINGDLASAVGTLKQQPGGDIIVFGGVGFASALVAANLVDEYQLFVNPAALGAGEGIFGSQRDGLPLRLIRSTAYSCGMVVNRYAAGAAG